MSFRYVKDFQSQVMAVRRHWAGKDARPGERLSISGEGSALLAMIDGLPADGVVVSKAELEALKAERDEAIERFDMSNKARHWLIKRLNEECSRAGFELQWTDGGGSECPGGWHRNPYITASSVLKRAVRKIREKLSEPGPTMVEFTEDEQKAWDEA